MKKIFTLIVGIFMATTNISVGQQINSNTYDTTTFGENRLLLLARLISTTQIMRISVADDNANVDEAIVRLVHGTTMGYDQNWDATYMPGQFLNVYSYIGTSRMNINAISPPNDSVRLNMGIKTTRTGLHSFTFTGLADVVSDYDLFLDDAFTGAHTRLADGQVVQFLVSSNPASTGEGRFGLFFRNLLTSIQPVDDTTSMTNMFEIYPNPAKQIINVKIFNNLYGPSYIEILSGTGALVKSLSLSLDSYSINKSQIDISDLNGFYFIRAKIDSKYYTRKLVVR